MEAVMAEKKKALTNAEKQKNYRERKKQKGHEELRGYLSPEGVECYQEISKVTGWDDSKLLSNAIRLTLAAYKMGQIGILNGWLEKNEK
ncbi:MAG: NTP pyrophosphatase (non-canonical NTP hydrolase) [Phenylobacterium sp.]